jgi:predicted  nucleic acid-binding Zn-ribbon protein
MECDICYRGHHPQRLPFICAVDARNQAYEGRLKNLQILLENETLRSQIGGLIADKGKPGTDALEAARADQARAQDKTAQILEAADRLRDDIKAARDEIRARKADLARRKADLATVSDGLADRRTRQLNDVQRSTQMLRYRWSQSAEEMAGTRAFLCAEAADLYGLRRVASKIKKNAAEYYLGRVPIIDLMSLNCEFLSVREHLNS